MSEDIFKQGRPAKDFDGGGTDDEGEVNSLRSMLHGGVQATSQTPPSPTVMMGNVPPQVQAAMQQPQFANHPLNQQKFQPTESFDQVPQAMSEAQNMYQNARKLMKQSQTEPVQQQQQQNFTPQQAIAQGKYGEFKDPKYEEVIKKLVNLGGNYEQIELPSRGKFYLRGEGPGNGILHIRRMTGKEEQILTTPRYVKKNQALNMIFKECIGEQVNPDLLLSEDRSLLLIYLRGISYSPIYDVEVKCPECQKGSQQAIHLNSLDVDFCPDDFGPNELQDTLPTSGLNIRYRLSTGKDEAEVQEHRDMRVKQFGSEVADDTTLFRAAQLIEEIDGVTNKVMIQQIVSYLPIGDMAYLRELINEPPFGVNTKVGIVCPYCSHEFEVEMPMELGFFFPKQNLQRRKKQPA